jgi:hypothetical protein
MKTPFSCKELELEYFAHAWISLASPGASLVFFYTHYTRGDWSTGGTWYNKSTASQKS